MKNVHECQMLVTRADCYANVDLYLNQHKDHYYWLVCEHLNPDADGCHSVKSDHHHWIIWNECHQRFTDSGLMSFLKRAANKWRRQENAPDTSRFFNHQRVKNLQSMLIYFSTGVRTILWDRSNVPDTVKEMAESVPEKARMRMKDSFTLCFDNNNKRNSSI